MMPKELSQIPDTGRILNEGVRKKIYQYLGMTYIFGSLVNFMVRYFIYNDPLINELLFNFFFFLIGLTFFFIQRLIKKADHQDSVLAIITAALIPVITLRFIDYASITVWAIPFIFVILSIIFNKRSIIITLAVSILLTQIWVWVRVPELMVQINVVSHLIRIGIFGIVLWLAIYVNRVYMQRLRENENQIRFQQVISQISNGFVSMNVSNLDEKINEMLRLSGEYCQADRSYLFLYSPDQNTVTNTHEWCNYGIEPQKHNMQNMPMHNFPWWHKKPKPFAPIAVSNVAEMSPEAAAEKAFLQAQSIQSYLVVPVVSSADKLLGFIGLDYVTNKKIWLEEEMSLIKIVAEVTSSSLEKQESENKIRESERILKAAFEGSHDAIIVMTKEGKFIDCNHRALELYGLNSKDEFLGKGPSYFSPPLQPDGSESHVLVSQYAKEALVEDSFKRFEWLHQRKDGSTFIAEVNLTSYMLGEDVILQANIANITERKIYEEKLQYLSMHDALTGLYNRAFFEGEMQRLSGSREYPVTIISADLDGLKLINDIFGHLQGDELLKASATVLQKSLRNSDILARIGGDEFAILLARTDNITGAMIAGRIRLQMDLHNSEHPELPLSISVGMATAEKETVPLQEIYKKADNLMYRDKMERKDSVRSLTVDMLLATLAERDYIRGGHAERIAGLCMNMGQKLNLSKQQLIDLAILAQVHDLGKVAVPDEILFKKAPLTDEEWEIMREHAEKGYHLAISSPDLAVIADLTLKHHEHWDGHGYPQGLQGETIPLECRIFAIADAFEVMTSGRPYSKAKSLGEAARELKQYSGTQFDPKIIEIFLKAQPGAAEVDGQNTETG